MRTRALLPALLLLASVAGAVAADGNRLAYLDEGGPYGVGRRFPKLTTPQWVGEEGVECVVILGIDDMGADCQFYERVLRPVLERFKQIDGWVPVSIFCNNVKPDEPHLQDWLKEGLNFEVHTMKHPCPILANTNFQAAFANFHDCVGLLSQVPDNHPVAFRTPCCDSINSPSPRLYAEIFNRTNSAGQFLRMDSSVMQAFTTNDLALP